jgi:hypothetical protein
MKSDVVVVQFVNVDNLGVSDNLQDYLNGDNKWELPILEKDIIDIKYAFSGDDSGVKTSTLLLHRPPTPKITS